MVVFEFFFSSVVASWNVFVCVRSLFANSEQKFLLVLPLALGAEVIVTFGILNKLSSIFGIASLLTGKPITVMEWILNIWSLVLLFAFVAGYMGIRNRQPLTVLLFAHAYLVDVVMSLAMTIVFCVRWFKTHNVDQTTVPTGADTTDSVSLAQETTVSVLLTVALLLSRIYFSFVLVGFARQLVRQKNLRRHNGSPKGSFRAKLQYLVLMPFESFWTGFASSVSSSYSPLMQSSSGYEHRAMDSTSSGTGLLHGGAKFELDDLDEERRGGSSA